MRGPVVRPDLEDAPPTRDEIEEQSLHVMAGIAAILEGLKFFLMQVDREVAARGAFMKSTGSRS
jgi:hypothetical protein